MAPVYKLSASSVTGRTTYGSMLAGNPAYDPWPNVNTFDLIQQTTLSTNQTSVTFSNINPKYTDIFLIINARTDNNDKIDDLLLQFNGVTSSASYASGIFNNVNNTSTGTSDITRTISLSGIGIPGLAGNTATSNMRGTVYAEILNSSATDFYKTVLAKTGFMELSVAAHSTGIASGYFVTLDAISSVTCKPKNGTNFLTNSTLGLYGVKRYGGNGS